MGDNLARRAAARPRRVSAAAVLGANVSLQDGELMEVHPARESQPGPDRLSAAAGRMERRLSGPQAVHQKHMPINPQQFHIPRKTKENRDLFHHVSTVSREYEDMMTILTSSYIDTTSASCFTYSTPRLVYSELLEKEFVEKRREMKADGRTDKELEESYCFLLADAVKTPLFCENGLSVGHSRITVLGNPSKGVYLSRYSDLLQMTPMTPGCTGEIIIFKVMKGKVKSMYENIKNLLDPTPRFDSHISKNISKVTSVNSYRAFELTQHYFYEYSFDELRQRPRQVCPYAVVSFHFKGKDSALPSKPLVPIRSNSQSAEGRKERAQFTVWSGDLVKGEKVLYQISLRSFSPPLLPHKLPEKLEIGWLMRLDKVTKLLPSDLFSYNLYSSSQEVVKSGHSCSLLEVTDRFRSTTSITKLLHELEKNRVVLVTPLTERGFLFLISSVQMATPPEREEGWKRNLQALFIFPENRDVSKSAVKPFPTSHDAPVPSISGGQVMPKLNQFIPALHHALIKARANPPPELSVGVERQAREYLIGLKDGKVRQYPLGEYESAPDDQGTHAPKHHRVNMDGYLRSYLFSPALYLLSVARARQMVEAHCGLEDPREAKMRRSSGGQREASSNSGGGKNNTEKMQQLIDLVMTCKRNAENEVKREEAGRVKAPGMKRKLEQETAERALKFLKASQEPGRPSNIQVEENPAPSSPDSLLSVIGSVGLKDVDLREDGSELSAHLLNLLTSLSQAARGTANPSPGQFQEEGGSYPFDRLATKLGLPTNCDIDLRRQEELEEQMAGSVSSLEGFSPSSHSGETNHRGGGGGGGRGGGEEGLRRRGGYEEEEGEWEIPWILIPITGLCSERYTQRDRNIPQDPRFQHLPTPASIAMPTKPQRENAIPSPEPSPPPSPLQCPSPDPSPPASPSHCPSPEPSPPPSPSLCPSPEPSPPTSPSPQPSSPPSPSQCPPRHPSPPSFNPSRCRALGSNELIGGANEERLAPTASRESAGASKDRGERAQQKDRSTSSSIHPFLPLAPERRKSPSPHPAGGEKEAEGVKGEGAEEKETVFPAKRELPKKRSEADEGKRNQEMEERVKKGALKEERKESTGSSLFVHDGVSSSPPCSLRGIDTIVDKHLGDFSSEIQLLLQGESIPYSCQQSPHSTSKPETSAFTHASISQFSQYVSFYNPCPPVQDYVSSLQDSMSSMLTELEDCWPSDKPTSSKRNEASLASTVSAFVSSIRANVKTDRDDEELTAAPSGGDVWQPLTITKQFSDAENNRNSPSFRVTLSKTTSVSGSGTSVLHPPPLPSTPPPPPPPPSQHSHLLEITRTVPNDLRETQVGATGRTVQHNSGADSTNYEVTLPGFSGNITEPSPPSEPVCSSASEPVPVPGSGLAPPATALSSLISQLQPEVFNSLVEIIKDVKRNSLQFYLHSSESGDPVYEGIKELLLKQGNVQVQSPLSFLDEENPESRLLVIIKNKEISGRVQEIPGLVSLKRHPSVVFMGIDMPDDVMNNSFNELFVSGGCIVPDELILNPDLITYERLAALLLFLEQQSSPESVWRWKVHCKTHKKLKEQARFRRDAANLLDLLSTYQKRQIVEFLPYHHCDMMNHQSPDLPCLLELQSRYTQYRHTVFLTEHHFEKFAAYSSVGVIVASIDEILHNFSKLVGDQDVRDEQPVGDEIPKAFAAVSGSLQHHGYSSKEEKFIQILQQVDSETKGWSALPQPKVSEPLTRPQQAGNEVQFLDVNGAHLPHKCWRTPENWHKISAVTHGRASYPDLWVPDRQELTELKKQSQVFKVYMTQPRHLCRGTYPASVTAYDHPVELINPISSTDQPHHLLHQSTSVPPPPSDLSDQLVPDASCKDRPLQSTPDFEVLRQAISQLRAERQAQLQELQELEKMQQQRIQAKSLQRHQPSPADADTSSGPGEPVQSTSGKTAVAATLDLIHSALQGEEEEEGGRAERGGEGGTRDQREGDPVRVRGTLRPNQGLQGETPALLTNQNQAAAQVQSHQKDLTNDRSKTANEQHGDTVSSSTADGPSGGDRSRKPQSDTGPPTAKSRTAGAVSDTGVSGSVTVVTEPEKNLSTPALQQQPQQSLSPLQVPNQVQGRGSGLLHLPQPRNQTFSPRQLLTPLSSLRGLRSLLRPTPLWTGPWGFQQTGRDFSGPGLLGEYQPNAQPGAQWHRRGQRGRGFNRM